MGLAVASIKVIIMETGKLEEIRYLPSLLFSSIAAIVNCPFPFASRPRRETLHGGDVAQWQPLLTTGEPSTRDLKVNLVALERPLLSLSFFLFFRSGCLVFITSLLGRGIAFALATLRPSNSI